MKLHALNCHNCGGLLKIPDHARYVTCAYCGSQLAIRKSEGVRFTEEIEQIQDRLDELTENNELQLLNLEWAAERETFKAHAGNGGFQIPTRSGAVFAGIALVAFSAVWCVISYAFTSDAGPFRIVLPLFGIGILVAGLSLAVNTYRKAIDYEAANRRYQQRKDEILRQKRAANARARDRRSEQVEERPDEAKSPTDLTPRWKRCDYFGLVPTDDDDPWRR